MKKRRLHKTPAFWILIAVLAFFLYGQFASANATFKKVDTSVVLKAIADEQVKSAVVVDREQLIQITLKSGVKISDATRVEASYIVGQETQVIDLLKAHQPPQLWDVKVPRTSALMSFIMTIGPIILIALVFLFFMNQMQGGGGRVMQFGRSKAKLMSKDTPKTTFADVAGVDEAVEELQEIKEFLAEPAKFQAIGAKIPKGVLLYGPPGTGKTLLARAVAGEANVPFYSISGSDFVEMFVGVGAARVRDLFTQAKANAPAIVFVDESMQWVVIAEPAWVAGMMSANKHSINY